MFPVAPETEKASPSHRAPRRDGRRDRPRPPWAHPKAAEWDTVSWDAWLREQTDDDEAVRNLAFATGSAMLTKPTHAFSLLQSLLMAASAGSYSNLVDADFILDKRVVGGLQQVPLLLAERLGDDVFLSQPVHSSTTEGGRRGHRRRRHRARPPRDPRARAGALQPHLVRAAAAAPAAPDAPAHLDGLRHQGARRLRDALLARAGSGTAFSPYELSHEAYDNTNHGDERGTLVGFVSDLHADGVFELSAEERKERILESLSTTTAPRRRTPSSTTRATGAAKWTRGAYAASFDLGGLHRYGADLRPVGPIHFACSDLAGAATSTSTVRSAWGASRRPDPRRDPRMSGHVVVGYTATKPGRDAVAFAARSRRPSTPCSTCDHPAERRPQRHHAPRMPATSGTCTRRPRPGSPRRSTASRRRRRARAVRPAESFAEGLVEIADELGASYIVVGAADGARAAAPPRLDDDRAAALLRRAGRPRPAGRARSRPRPASPG
jgi:putrescine oxidase